MKPLTPDEIRRARERAGITQTEAAALVFNPVQTWQLWEQGMAEMNLGIWCMFLDKTGLENLSPYREWLHEFDIEHGVHDA